MSKTCEDPLHGITVVIDSTGPMLYIGRYHSETNQGLLLLDADARSVGDAGEKAAYLARAARLGVFKNTDRVVVPRAEVASVRKLIEYAA